MTKKGKLILGIFLGVAAVTGTILLTKKAVAASKGMSKADAIKIILDTLANPAEPYLTKDYLNAKADAFLIAWAQSLQRDDINFNYQGTVYMSGSGDSVIDVQERKV